MKIGVIGGGAWGTALAQVAARGGRDVLLWAREDEVVEQLHLDRIEHARQAPGDRIIRAAGRRVATGMVVRHHHCRAIEGERVGNRPKSANQEKI